MSERKIAEAAGVAVNSIFNIRNQCRDPSITRVNAMLAVAGYELKVVKKDDNS